jgi:hypothetical protein
LKFGSRPVREHGMDFHATLDPYRLLWIFYAVNIYAACYRFLSYPAKRTSHQRDSGLVRVTRKMPN